MYIEKAADGYPETPEFSAKVLTAALKVQKAQQQRKKAELQELMEKLVQSQNQFQSESQSEEIPYPSYYEDRSSFQYNPRQEEMRSCPPIC